MQVKKILMLGGSPQQIVAIETAKKIGLHTILCDYLPDNPGQFYADKFYQVSTTDKEAVLKVATDEVIDYVIAYASDPAAPTAAYVAEKLGLPTNPFRSVNILCNKQLFRLFLREHGFNVPASKDYNDANSAVAEAGEFDFPVIVKPVDSSGSKGVSIIREKANLTEAVNHAFSFSRSNRIIIEEYIEKGHKFLVGGDIFVSDGEIVQWGLMNCHRDNNVNPLVPVGKSYPVEIKDDTYDSIKHELQRMVTELNIKNGPMNVELLVDKMGKVFLIDVGPRSGGNMIPDLLGIIFSCNEVEMSIRAAMGQRIIVSDADEHLYYATHNIHCRDNGTLTGIYFSEEIEKFIIRKNIYNKLGDKVQFFDNASKAIGIVFMKFESMNQMMKMLNDINQHIIPTVRN